MRLQVECHQSGLASRVLPAEFAGRVLPEWLQIENHPSGLAGKRITRVGLQIEYHQSGFAGRVLTWVCIQGTA